MSRRILDPAALHPGIAEKVASNHRETVDEVVAAVAAHPVVLVGMAQNPFVRKAKKALTAAGVDFHGLDYGSYLGQWQRRLAIKMWSGWPTFPMVFVHGVLVGGFDDVSRLIESGELKGLIEAGRG